jgi:CheY-like chemotaxis protein
MYESAPTRLPPRSYGACMSLALRTSAPGLAYPQPARAPALPPAWPGLESSLPMNDSPRRPACFPVGTALRTQTRVLVADQQSSAESLVRLLRGLGYWLAETAFCGASALQSAQDFRPAIVLIALDLPDMSAAYVARRLRQRCGPEDLRLIALADDHSLASRDRVHESGFERYLTRPVSAAALGQVLRARLSWPPSSIRVPPRDEGSEFDRANRRVW